MYDVLKREALENKKYSLRLILFVFYSILRCPKILSYFYK